MKTMLMIGAVVVGSLAPATARAAPVNWSTLLTLSPGGSATMGFVLNGSTNDASFYLVRAVGPSLAALGVSGSCTQVGMTLYDANHQTVGPLITVSSIAWPQTFAAVGAFPLTAASGDAYEIFLLTNGTYTAQVTDESGKGGTALIEVYSSGPPVINPEGPT